MKMKKNTTILTIFTALIVSGCMSTKLTSIDCLAQEETFYLTEEKSLQATAHKLTSGESKKYLAVDLPSCRIVPVHICIKNNTGKSLFLKKDSILLTWTSGKSRSFRGGMKQG